MQAKKIYFSTKLAHLYLKKKKCLDPSGHLVYQLMDTIWKGDKGNLNSYKYKKKTQATMKRKVFIPLYAEHIHFLVKRAGCLVTKIYAHYTFEQSKFKKDFIIMNQILHQNANSLVGKDFYKFMNHSNFGYDCRNNIDNFSFAPISDEFDEASYLKKYQSPFDEKISEFASCKLLEQEIESSFNISIMKLKTDNEYFDAKEKFARK